MALVDNNEFILVTPRCLSTPNIFYQKSSTSLLQVLFKNACQPQNKKYPALMGKIWGVYCENFQENWLRYNSTAL